MHALKHFVTNNAPNELVLGPRVISLTVLYDNANENCFDILDSKNSSTKLSVARPSLFGCLQRTASDVDLEEALAQNRKL